jgi:hypothetical protein
MPVEESGHMVGIHFNSTYVGNNGNGFLGFSSSGNVAHGRSGVSTTISCVICHDGIVDPDPLKVDTFAMYSTSSNFNCSTCHKSNTRTKLQTGNIMGTNLHINGKKDVVLQGITLKTKAQLKNNANALGWTRPDGYKGVDDYDTATLTPLGWNPVDKSCLTACHVNQSGITWGKKLMCNSCHANQ